MGKSNKNKMINIFICIALFCFAILTYRLSVLALKEEIDGVNLKEFADNRSVVSTTIKASRGDIFDINGKYLAQNVSSYTLIAYLDPIRSEGEDELYHVKDKEKTAKGLATVINMKYEDILDILKQEGLYQVEFGFAGKGLTELEKEKIEKLKLPGVDFIEDEKRYYPNGNFASYTLGYAKKDEEGNIAGEMGLEMLLNDVLAGTDGNTTYQKDLNGYKIAGTKDITTPAVDGSDVYLTIDSNIQLFVEQAIKDAYKKYPSEWMTIVVAEAKTGRILASSQYPSFDPNTLDIDNWINLSVGEPYEPGSIMKIYTYMAAMEAGTYEGEKTFVSGKYVTDDGTKIYDWDKNGFGTITYDQGFHASSNVGVINIVNNFIDKKIMEDYFKKMGFGEKTGITLAGEEKGKIKFTYQTEIYNAAFGQGITTTPMQHIQALTAIANDGVMLQPYIVDKVVSEDGEVVFAGKRTEKSVVATHETAEKVKELMYDTVHNTWYAATATDYKVDGYDLIGKTGTAQLVNPNTGAYYTSDYYTIKSFVGMWPKEEPEVIIYASVKKPQNASSKSLTTSVKSIVKNVSKYLNIFNTKEEKEMENYTVDNYLNKKVDLVIKDLNSKNIKTLVLGNGNKIVDQYPSKNSVVDSNERIILLTNDNNYTMPDIKNFSKKDVRAVCNLLDLKCNYEGYGYVNSYSIKKGSKVKKNQELKVVFKELYKI